MNSKKTQNKQKNKTLIKKVNVLILAGGKSGEHDISLMTAKGVLEHIDTAQFVPYPVVIDRDNKYWYSVESFDKPYDEINKPLNKKAFKKMEIWEAVKFFCSLKPVIAFIAMHGPFGEDGRIQSLLDILEIPYVGSNHYGSSLAMNKCRSKDVYAQHGIASPPYIEIRSESWRLNNKVILNKIIEKLGESVVIKPVSMGSSVGMSIAFNAVEINNAINIAFEHDEVVLIEKYIKGDEYTAPVLELNKFSAPQGLPIIKIVPKERLFFDFKSKYDDTLNEEICPAPISESLELKIREIGVKAHVALGLRHISRTDVIVDKQGKIWVLETNSIPGLTEQSLFPKSAGVFGIPYQELITSLLQSI